MFSPVLCLGLNENVSNVLLNRLLLIARHYIYIYTCNIKNSITKLQEYIQLLLTSMKIEKKIALENNTLNTSLKVVEPIEGRPPVLKYIINNDTKIKFYEVSGMKCDYFMSICKSNNLT